MLGSVVPLIATIVTGLGLAFIFGTLAQRLRMSPLVGYATPVADLYALIGPATVSELDNSLGALEITLSEVIDEIPEGLSDWNLAIGDGGHVLRYEFDSTAERTGIASLMRRLGDLGIQYKDLSTHQSSLEDIFVELVHGRREPA